MLARGARGGRVMLGYMVTAGQGAGDRVLHAVARDLIAEGVRVAGAVQVNTERGAGQKCHMDLLILGDQARHRISQDLGRAATGCRLDPGGLEEAVARVEADLDRGAPDLLFVNKFGKQEADGRGFRPVIARGLEMGVPVLTGVGQGNLAAFRAFAGDLAEALPPEAGALVTWCRTRIGTPAS